MADRLTLRSVLAAACAVVWLLAPGGLSATHRGDGVLDEVAIQMSYQQPTIAGAHGQVMARLVLDDGSPVVGVEVTFRREVDFLGPRLIGLGSAMTDAYGTARVAVDTADPAIRVQARYEGSERYLPVEVTTAIRLADAPAGPAAAGGGRGEPDLAVIAAVMPPLLAGVALAVWLSLLGLTAATVLGIKRGGPPASSGKEA